MESVPQDFDPPPVQEPPVTGPVLPPGSGTDIQGDPSQGSGSKKKIPVRLIAAAAACLLILAAILFFFNKDLFKGFPGHTVKYKITYIDENGALLEETVYTGHVGDEIDHTAPDRDGYTLQDREQSMILEDDEDQNRLIFRLLPKLRRPPLLKHRQLPLLKHRQLPLQRQRPQPPRLRRSSSGMIPIWKKLPVDTCISKET